MSGTHRFTRRKVLQYSLAAAGGLWLPASAGEPQANDPGQGGNEESTDLLIIGAGPFGLAIAAYAQHHGIAHRVVGVPMGFWRDNMPEGMLLRSTCDWSLDPVGVHTIDAFLGTQGKSCRDVEPLSRNFYLDYARWFQQEKALGSAEKVIVSLQSTAAGLVAFTADGARIRSRSVVLALGFGNFTNVPAELAALFPSYGHTCNLVDFSGLRGRRVLIIGGRQSAFEWAALIREAGAESVDVCYRHDTPLFEASDWGWVNTIVDSLSEDPGWYRRLTAEEKAQLNQRFWEAGRLRLEPWLADRIDYPNVRLHPRTNVVGTEVGDAGVGVTLDNDEVMTVDDTVFATGYKVDFSNVPFLAESLLGEIAMQDGFPSLGLDFQTSVPGLYVTSLAATRDFGAFLGFTVSVRAQANIIGRSVKQRLLSGDGAATGFLARLQRPDDYSQRRTRRQYA